MALMFKKAMKRSLHFLIFCLIGSHAFAAEFSFVSGAAMPAGETGWNNRIYCNIRMDGEIVEGDAEKFDTFLANIADRIEADPEILGYPRIATLCLDSAGGSLDEAVRIAEAIRKDRPFPMRSGIPFVATRLEANTHCASACAIIFMAGTYDDWEGPSTPMRSMHPTARLGFHAPALSVPQGDYREVFVSTAYNTSINAIASILRVMNVGAAPDGTLYSGGSPWLVAPLLETMLATPSSQMTYVETVDDAGRWEIPVYPIVQKPFGYRTAYSACINHSNWDNNRPSGKPSELSYSNVISYKAETRAGQIDTLEYFIILDELNSDYCQVSAQDGGWFSVNLAPQNAIEQGFITLDGSQAPKTVRVDTGSRALLLHDPETPLRDLAPRASAPEVQETPAVISDTILRTAWVPLFGGEKLSLWDHNGSLMAWESRGANRWVWYYRPRQGLLDSGVTAGTLLFEGQIQNGLLSGEGRRFSQACGETVYPLSGRAKGTTVTLDGLYTRRNPDCSRGAERRDQLVFEYIAGAPSLALGADGTAPQSLMRLEGVRTGLNFRAGPQATAPVLFELPPDLGGFQLQRCIPAIPSAQWQAASQIQQAQLLSRSWCGLIYNGQLGYVSGKFLRPIGAP